MIMWTPIDDRVLTALAHVEIYSNVRQTSIPSTWSGGAKASPACKHSPCVDGRLSIGIISQCAHRSAIDAINESTAAPKTS